MDKRPKNDKNLEYELRRMTGNDDNKYAADNRFNENMARDWAKQYRRSGDKRAAERCERTANDLRWRSNQK